MCRRIRSSNDRQPMIGDASHSAMRSPGQLEQRASLLSALLKGSRQPLPATYMDMSDADSEDDDEDMEDAEAEENGDENDVVAEEELLSAAGGSAPVPIPSTSEAFLKAQREALTRFVYAHQIEEMRKQCAAYFARQARFNEAVATDNNVSCRPCAPVAPTEACGSDPAKVQPTARQRKPGF
ncbi:hypothetical protein VOLCADRAFT_116822 [Volvox carteri f. nagariensis]|uniref:Uncharacterized protein n=1 Tax=Volvox carteri f. nagariensis TaxID=3068 RepID=D8TPR3_VOLCA|nr:uncharacterized protein VOLCADRAFT_116822 [Volvox carteri f. nagariensis]EFJ50661.1 hypothetical protein VOLCADRAFT_116822 [Volvox carteri f. nagariensis]|eukprot:XP_002948254.1 hypothetical protein VOLCADRAFT_116822 [Volvox carteri f. nagariensis]